MFKFVLCLAPLIAFVKGDCVPTGQENWYWKTPCDGQSFQNVLTATNIVATQNGNSVDSQGGIDATANLTAVITLVNNYGKTVTTPYADLAFQQYVPGIGGGCKWSDVPTFGFTDNMDACSLLDNCHLDNPPNPTSLTVVANIAQIAGTFVGVLQVNTYYGISITFKDGKTNKLTCFYIQDKLIKV